MDSIRGHVVKRRVNRKKGKTRSVETHVKGEKQNFVLRNKTNLLHNTVLHRKPWRVERNTVPLRENEELK